MMRTFRKLAASGRAVAAALLLSGSLATGGLAQTLPTDVAFGANGEVQGRLSEIGPGQWGEFGPDGVQAFTFEETARTGDTLDLEDPSRGIALQLDFAAGSISYGAIGSEKQPLYDIVSTAGADAPAQADPQQADQTEPPADAAATVDEAQAGTADGADSAGTTDGAGFETGEGARVDTADGALPDTADAIPSATAQGAEAGTGAEDSLQTDRVAYGEVRGEFVRVAPGQWSELDKDGNAIAAFEERSRTADQILLEDPSRNLALTLDLANSVILFGAIGAGQEPLYDIVGGAAGPAALPEAAAEPSTGAPAEDAAADPSLAAPAGDAAVDAADFAALVAASETVWPSQLRLGISGAFVGRFDVSWTNAEAPEESASESWSSGEQPSPYFMALPLPPGASDVRIVGEVAQPDGSWRTVLQSDVSAPDNRCYLLSGNALLPQGEESEEPSDAVDAPCP